MKSTGRPRAASHTTYVPTLLADLRAESDGTDVDNNALPRMTTSTIRKVKTYEFVGERIFILAAQILYSTTQDNNKNNDFATVCTIKYTIKN